MGNSNTKVYQAVATEPPPSYESVMANWTGSVTTAVTTIPLEPVRSTDSAVASSASSSEKVATPAKPWQSDDLITYRDPGGHTILVPFDFNLIPPHHLTAFLDGLDQTPLLTQLAAGKVKVANLTNALLDNIARYALIRAADPLDASRLTSKVTHRYLKPGVMRYLLLSRDCSRIQTVTKSPPNDRAGALLDEAILNQGWLRLYEVVDIVAAWLQDWSLIKIVTTTTLFKHTWQEFGNLAKFLALINRPESVDTLILNLISQNVALLNSLDYQIIQKIQPRWQPDRSLRFWLQVQWQTILIKTESYSEAYHYYGNIKPLMAMVVRYQIPINNETLRCCFATDWLLFLAEPAYLTSQQLAWLETCLDNAKPEIQQRLTQAIALYQNKTLSASINSLQTV